MGEWDTATIGIGEGNKIELLKTMHFPHSLGLLYSAFTYFCGFKVNSGEYKLMGLAPYGEPKYADIILEKLIDLQADGSLAMDMSYFNYCEGLRMTNDEVRRALRRTAAQSRNAHHPARDGPRRVDPGGHREGRARAWRATPASSPAARISAWPAASR